MWFKSKKEKELVKLLEGKVTPPKLVKDHKQVVMHWGTYLPHIDAAEENEVFFDFATKTVYQAGNGKWNKLTKE